MAGFVNTLRGDGLARVHRALDGLEADPLGLDRTRGRFSQSPPLFLSSPSGTTTRSASPELPSDEQRRREQRELPFQRRRKLMEERAASLPLQQFKAQRKEETERIWIANPHTNWMSKIPIGGTEEKEATQTIKKRWVEQGIWKDVWDEMAAGRYMNVGRWKHEDPVELETEAETVTEAEFPTFGFFGVPQKHPQPKQRRPKSDAEKQRVAERRAVRDREREASRPYHQFVYQISKERERIQEESANREDNGATDINTRAYENIKSTWAKRGIWNERWGILPGMLWKHEEPLEEETDDGRAPVPVNPLANGRYEEGEAPVIRIFGSPSPVKSNHHQAPGALSPSQQGPPADIVSAGSENGDAERSSSALNLPPHGSGRRVLPPTGQAPRSSKRNPSHKDGLPANASLGPVNPSEVSKAAGKRKAPQRRRLKILRKSSSDSLPSSSGVDAAEPQPSPLPDLVAPRRSKRIQPPAPSISSGPTRAASTNPSKRTIRSKPKRNVTSSLAARSSSKPQGISKKPAKITRGKARGK